MKIPWILLTIRNFWNYYFLKWGALAKATVFLKSRPDFLPLDIDRSGFQTAKGVLKDLCRLIQRGEFEYDRKDQTMVVFSSEKKRSLRCPFCLKRVASTRYFLERDISFQDSEDESLFQVGLGGMSFLARKNFLGDAVTLSETFLDGEYDFLRPYLTGASVLDLGAYIGDTIALFASWGAKQIFAFEPHPELYRLAIKNIALNHLEDRVVLRNEGVAAKEGTLCIKEDTDAGASPAFGLYQSDRGAAISLRLVAIKNIVAELGQIDVLKMDCEGAEFEIFAGLSSEELKKIKVIGLEYHRDPEPIIAKLESAGFDVKIVKVLKPGQGVLFARRNDIRALVP